MAPEISLHGKLKRRPLDFVEDSSLHGYGPEVRNLHL
jgi:hypothetical protein